VQQRVPNISKLPINGCISSNYNPRTKLGYDTDKLLFDLEIAKTEGKNRKKKKQATIKPPGESSSFYSPSLEKPLVIDVMANRRGEENRPPRRILGDYAYQQEPKDYSNIVIFLFSNKVVELKPT